MLVVVGSSARALTMLFNGQQCAILDATSSMVLLSGALMKANSHLGAIRCCGIPSSGRKSCVEVVRACDGRVC